MLADMAIQLNAARLGIYRAAASADPFPDPLLAAQAKVFASNQGDQRRASDVRRPGLLTRIPDGAYGT
jgi:alkylation response protein AidB-like acyl-CoA dehydrogenase